MNITEIISAAEASFADTGDNTLSANLYKTWLATHGADANSAPVWFNYGVVQSAIGDKDESAESYRAAKKLMPNLWQASANLANYHESLGEIAAAVELYQDALELPLDRDGSLFIRNQLGRLYEGARRFNDAKNLYAQSLEIDPSQKDAFQHWFYLKQKQCDWPLNTFPRPSSIREIAASLGPLSAMAYFDDLELLNFSCTQWMDRYKSNKHFYHLVEPTKKYSHKRLKIGYVSCDFRMHAVTFLAAQIYELHNRAQFEVFGFDFSVDDNSPWRKKIIDGMDQCHPIHSLSDENAAKLIASLEIDILVDMVGLTAGGRPGIFMYRPAPIQVSYLGFLGPVGIPEMDYIVCDSYVVPPESAIFYGAKPIYLPFYQVNNSLRQSASPPSRSAVGLPDDAFVFCAINNSYKLTQEVFYHWMQVLLQTNNSVLWLLEENPEVKENLLRESRKYGIDPNRLVFAKPIDPSDYLARFACADLFLDTSPYNAGITASDALWMGLPVLTCPGNTYVSRMAADLLIQMDLGEFVCQSWGEYVKKAVNYCQSKDMAKTLLNQRFTRNSPIFNSSQFVQNLEANYLEISAK